MLLKLLFCIVAWQPWGKNSGHKLSCQFIITLSWIYVGTLCLSCIHSFIFMSEWKQSVTPAMQFCASWKYGASRAIRAASEIKAQPLLSTNTPALGHFFSFFCSTNSEAMYCIWCRALRESWWSSCESQMVIFSILHMQRQEKSSKNCGLVPAVWTDVWLVRVEYKGSRGVLSSS